MKKLLEISWYRILVGILLLIILIMALKMNPEVNVDINNGDLLSIFNKDCFSENELSFRCEYTNKGDFVPFKEDGKKHWRCVVENKILYEVEAC